MSMKHMMHLVLVVEIAVMASTGGQAELLAYEGFVDYTGDMLWTNSGGDGWADTWHGYNLDGPCSQFYNLSNSLAQGASPFIPAGGSVVGTNASSGGTRALSVAMTTTEPTNYYISFSYRRETGLWCPLRLFSTNDAYNGGQVEIGGGYSEDRFMLGKPTTNGQRRSTSTTMGFTNRTTYFVVARIAMNASGNYDYVYSSIYEAGDTVPSVEPVAWDIANEMPYSMDIDVLDAIAFKGESSDSVVKFDEIRIGTTWDDVAVSGYTDGIPNWWWEQYGLALTNTAAGDNDNDSWNNRDEYVSDTDPTNAASFYYNYITNSAIPGEIIELIAGPPTTNSHVYDAWWSTDLVHGAWTALGFDRIGQTDGGSITFTVTNRPGQSFYRTGVKVP